MRPRDRPRDWDPYYDSRLRSHDARYYNRLPPPLSPRDYRGYARDDRLRNREDHLQPSRQEEKHTKAEYSSHKRSRLSNDTSAVPEPWQVQRSRDGKVYYYHPITQATTWKLPTAQHDAHNDKPTPKRARSESVEIQAPDLTDNNVSMKENVATDEQQPHEEMQIQDNNIMHDDERTLADADSLPVEDFAVSESLYTPERMLSQVPLVVELAMHAPGSLAELCIHDTTTATNEYCAFCKQSIAGVKGTFTAVVTACEGLIPLQPFCCAGCGFAQGLASIGSKRNLISSSLPAVSDSVWSISRTILISKN